MILFLQLLKIPTSTLAELAIIFILTLLDYFRMRAGHSYDLSNTALRSPCSRKCTHTRNSSIVYCHEWLCFECVCRSRIFGWKDEVKKSPIIFFRTIKLIVDFFDRVQRSTWILWYETRGLAGAVARPVLGLGVKRRLWSNIVGSIFLCMTTIAIDFFLLLFCYITFRVPTCTAGCQWLPKKSTQTWTVGELINDVS